MTIIDDLLKDVPLPPMIRIRQMFADAELTDIAGEVHRQMALPQLSGRIQPGARIAVAVGSR